MSQSFSLKENINKMLKCFKDSDFDTAVNLAECIIKDDQKNSTPYKILSLIYLKRNDLVLAKKFSEQALEINNTDPDIFRNLAYINFITGNLDKAEKFYKETIKLKPNCTHSMYEYGLVLNKLKKYSEAEQIYKNSLNFTKDNAKIYFNLALSQYHLNKILEAEKNYITAIELKPDYLIAYYNLAITQKKLNKLEDAIKNNQKALEIKPDYIPAKHNLNLILRLKDLLKEIPRENLNKEIKLDPDPLILTRSVEKELLDTLCDLKFPTIEKTIGGPLFGQGLTSNYQLFNNDIPIIKKLEQDLTRIVSEKLNSKIYIMDSFYNILKAGSGSKVHNHIGDFDENNKIDNRKYSLVYYLSVGNQYSSQPGILRLYEPNKNILPSDEMIIIWPAWRKHSSSYNGDKDRLMIGINFYILK